MTNRLRPWSPYRVIAGEVASAITTQGYRKFWSELDSKMDPRPFAELERRISAAEEATRAIYRMMDQTANVLDADSTGDKP